jgi:hypothetical protein
MTGHVTVGGGFASSEPPIQPKAGAPAATADPIKMAKLTGYLQRISGTAKMVLPSEHHSMVDRLGASANQGLMAGEGADAVKNFALAISKSSVDAGVDAETVRNLNAQLKAIFAK